MPSETAEETGLRERKKRQTRQRIRRTAVAMFLERGFEDVSIADIADAAEVSRKTVFNYFPAKEDMVFDTAEISVFPDLAAAVRTRSAGEPPVQALRRFTRAELERRAEWTGLHDGVARFARLVMLSPTLAAAGIRRWEAVRADLQGALEEAAGRRVGSLDDERLSSLLRGGPRPGTAAIGADVVAELDAEHLVPRLFAQQVVAVLQTLSMTNQVHQVVGIRADDSAADALRAADIAFDLLEHGIGTRLDPPPQTTG